MSLKKLHSLSDLRKVNFCCATYIQGSTISDASLQNLMDYGINRVRLTNTFQGYPQNGTFASINGSTLTCDFTNELFLQERLTQFARLGLNMGIVMNSALPQSMMYLKERIDITIGVVDVSTTYNLTVGGVTVSCVGQASAPATIQKLYESVQAASSASPYKDYKWVVNPNYSFMVGTASTSAISNNVSVSKLGGAGAISATKNTPTKWVAWSNHAGSPDATDMELLTQYYLQCIQFIASFGIKDCCFDIGNEWYQQPALDWTIQNYEFDPAGKSTYINLTKAAVAAKARYTGNMKVSIGAPVCGSPNLHDIAFNNVADGDHVYAKQLFIANSELDYFSFHPYYDFNPAQLSGANGRQGITFEYIWNKELNDYAGHNLPVIFTESGPWTNGDEAAGLDQKAGAAFLSCCKIAVDWGVQEAWWLGLKMNAGNTSAYFSCGYDHTGADTYIFKAWKQLSRVTDESIPVDAVISQASAVVLAALNGFVFYRATDDKYCGMLWSHDMAYNDNWYAAPFSETATAVQVYVPDLNRALTLSKYNRNATIDTVGLFATISIDYGDFIYFEGN